MFIKDNIKNLLRTWFINSTLYLSEYKNSNVYHIGDTCIILNWCGVLQARPPRVSYYEEQINHYNKSQTVLREMNYKLPVPNTSLILKLLFFGKENDSTFSVSFLSSDK